jgi:hypothetical protein
MHRGLLLSILFIGQLFFAHSQAECFSTLEKAFLERGANPVPDAMHKNVLEKPDKSSIDSNFLVL